MRGGQVYVCAVIIALGILVGGYVWGESVHDARWRSYLVDRPIYVEACKNQEITERNALKSVEEARLQTEAVSPSKKSIKN